MALILAERRGGEIVSVDSMKIYRGMDIGTAKAPLETRRRIRHYMIDVADPRERFSLAQYLQGAAEAEALIRGKGKKALHSGGTPLYVRGLLHGIFEGPSADWALRRELAERARREGVASLHDELKRLDPAAAERIHPNDVKRVTRAIEVARLTGEPISGRQVQVEQPPRPATVVVLRRAPEDLRRRIEGRVDRMLQSGLAEEVQALKSVLGPTAREAVGYKEMLDFLDGRCSLAEVRERICKRTWALARKQMTWFRGMRQAQWVDVAADEPPERTAERAHAVLSAAGFGSCAGTSD